MRVTRRLAGAGTADGITPPGMKMRSTHVLQDEYRAGFPLPLPHQASATSDSHGCPWCLSSETPPSGPARPRALNHDVLPGGGQGECGVLALLLRDKRVGRNRTHRRAGGVSMPAGMIPCRHANSCSGQGSCGRHSSWRHSRSAPRRSPPPPRPRPGRRLRSGSRNASGKAVFNTEDGRAPAVTCRSGRLSGGYSQASMAWSSASRSMYGSPLSRPTVSPSPARVKGPGWVSMRPSPTSRSPW